MSQALSKKITFLSLIRYTLPTIVMMIFFALYTIVDGMFISQFVGANALSSTNIVYPVINILIGIGVMFATGGSALVAKSMGEDKLTEAREHFSLITLSAVLIGVILSISCLLLIKPLIYSLGATDILYKDCYAYLTIMLICSPFIILKMYFDYFLVTAGAAHLGLISSIMGGLINVVLDYIFIVPLQMGVAGAALATCLGYVFPTLIGLLYFCKSSHTLHFVKPKFHFNVIIKSCSNGASEMVTQLAASVTTILYNFAMIRLLGEEGIAAITIILYVQFLLSSAYLGFTSGVSPRISYNYGSRDREQLRNLVRYSFIFISLFAVSSFLITSLGSDILISLFAKKGSSLFEIALNGFKIFSIGFLLSGFNIFASGMFTAFSNGKISALLSLLRTFVFFVIGLLILPRFLGVNGVWLIVPFAELSTLVISIICIYKYRHTYMYTRL